MSDNRQILLVDDDRDIVRGASVRLRAAGYETMAAEDGETGVSIATDKHPDAIVLDVRMPGMDGLAALAKLREKGDTKDIPVVMLSASIVDEKASLDGGARFFLKKPYRGDTLVTAVRNALGGPNAEKGE